MVRELERTAQFTIRIPQELKDELQESARNQDIDGIVWVRHAIREKLVREQNELPNISREEIREIAREEAMKLIQEHAGTNISNKGIGNKQNVQIGGK